MTELETLRDLLAQKKKDLLEYAAYPVHVKRLRLQIERLENKIKELEK